MEIKSILSEFSQTQRRIIYTFIILTPLCFSALYLYIPQFCECDVYLQTIFSIAYSIANIYATLFFIASDRFVKHPQWSILSMMTLPSVYYMSISIVLSNFLIRFGYFILVAACLISNILFRIIYRRAFEKAMNEFGNLNGQNDNKCD